MPATRKQLLARLHCVKRDNGWGEDEYRDILAVRTDKRSAAHLPDRELAHLVVTQGALWSATNEWAFINAALPRKLPLLRGICAICRAVEIRRTYAEGTAQRALKLVGAEVCLSRFSENQLWIVASALERTKRFGRPRGTEAPMAI